MGTKDINYSEGIVTQAKQLKEQEILQKKADIEDTKSRIYIDSLYVLKAILIGQMIVENPGYSSDPKFKPMIEDQDDVDIIRDKIMEIAKKL